jgi:hypothetical protein
VRVKALDIRALTFLGGGVAAKLGCSTSWRRPACSDWGSVFTLLGLRGAVTGFDAACIVSWRLLTPKSFNNSGRKKSPFSAATLGKKKKAINLSTDGFFNVGGVDGTLPDSIKTC